MRAVFGLLALLVIGAVFVSGCVQEGGKVADIGITGILFRVDVTENGATSENRFFVYHFVTEDNEERLVVLDDEEVNQSFYWPDWPSEDMVITATQAKEAVTEKIAELYPGAQFDMEKCVAEGIAIAEEVMSHNRDVESGIIDSPFMGCVGVRDAPSKDDNIYVEDIRIHCNFSEEDYGIEFEQYSRAEIKEPMLHFGAGLWYIPVLLPEILPIGDKAGRMEQLKVFHVNPQTGKVSKPYSTEPSYIPDPEESEAKLAQYLVEQDISGVIKKGYYTTLIVKDLDAWLEALA